LKTSLSDILRFRNSHGHRGFEVRTLLAFCKTCNHDLFPHLMRSVDSYKRSIEIQCGGWDSNPHPAGDFSPNPVLFHFYWLPLSIALCLVHPPAQTLLASIVIGLKACVLARREVAEIRLCRFYIRSVIQVPEDSGCFAFALLL
jgi:hypothetical protein